MHNITAYIVKTIDGVSGKNETCDDDAQNVTAYLSKYGNAREIYN
jgi:hypothetical protein